jgi:DNA repair protein RadC
MCAMRRIIAQRPSRKPCARRVEHWVNAFARVDRFAHRELVQEYLRFTLASKEYEVFCLIFLDARHRLIGMIELFRGTVDGAQVHPREVVKESLGHNAASVILAHNHPSGVAEPSQADEMITRRVKDALAVVDIQVLDHLVVAGTNVLSFAERGLI